MKIQAVGWSEKNKQKNTKHTKKTGLTEVKPFGFKLKHVNSISLNNFY